MVVGLRFPPKEETKLSTENIVKRSATVFPYRGKWRLQYFDSEGRIRTKTAPTKQDAYMALGLVQQQVNQGLLPKPSREVPILGDWLGMWLEQKSIQLKWSTTESLEALIRLHIRPALGHLRLNQVSPLLVEAFYSSLQGKKELSPATIKKVHTIMHQAFQQAVRYGQLPTNPMLSTKTPQANKPRIEVLSREQVKRVLAVAANQGPESYLRWLLALHYGLRQGETLALTWGDFEPSTGQLSINKSVNAKAGEGSIISRPKTDKANRIIPLTLQAQKSWKALAEYNTDVQDSTLVFQNTTGGYLNARTDYDRWHHLLKQAEVPKLKLHAARHTAATLLIESGADLRSVQLILGHSSPTFTASTYVHPSLMHIRSALEGVQISSNSRPMPLSLTTENETANIDS